MSRIRHYADPTTETHFVSTAADSGQIEDLPGVAEFSLLTKSTAIQYAKDNIPANSIHPGVIETPMTAPNLLADEQARQITISRHPIGRLGQPEDVAYGALFLASDESSFMTGSELVIDGGLTAQ